MVCAFHVDNPSVVTCRTERVHISTSRVVAIVAHPDTVRAHDSVAFGAVATHFKPFLQSDDIVTVAFFADESLARYASGNTVGTFHARVVETFFFFCHDWMKF